MENKKDNTGKIMLISMAIISVGVLVAMSFGSGKAKAK